MVALKEQFIDPAKNTKMLASDRVFILEKIDPHAPDDDSGVVDKRILTGANKMHAIRDESSFNLWYFKYDHGIVPEALKGQRFTKFDIAKAFLEKYFATRNIRIKEVI